MDAAAGPAHTLAIVLRLLTLVAAAAALAACDSDNVSWKFVSNPSGTPPPPGGAVIVITKTGTMSVTLPMRSLPFDGEQSGRRVRVRLATSADAAAIEREAAVEVRCPSLPGGSLVVRGGTLTELPGGPLLWEIAALDCAELHPAAFGPGRLLIASRGNVVLLEHAAGLVVFGDGPEPSALPAGWTIDASVPTLQLVALGQPPRVLAGRAPPTLGERITREGGSIDVLGPSGEVLVRLPESALTNGGEEGGVFLHADLAASEPRCTLVAATDNRYLLRLDH